MSLSGGGRPSARPLRRRVEILLVLALTAGLGVVYLLARDAGPLQVVEGVTLGWRFALRGPQAPGPDVALVTIDERTLTTLGRWPFSRRWLAQAVDRIAAAGARTIVFDLLLVGSEARSAVPGGPAPGNGGAGVPAAGPEPPLDAADEELVAAIARAGDVVVPFAFAFDPAEANLGAPLPSIEAAAYRVVLTDPSLPADLPGPPAGILAPLAPFLAAGRPAHVSVILDADGHLRQVYPVLRFGELYYPALPIEAARLYLGLPRERVAVEVGAGIGLGDRVLATGRGMALAINYAGPEGTFPRWSLIDVINGDVPADALRGRIVMIGATAAGLGDRFATPYDARLPGVEVFANVIDNILSRGFIERSPLADGFDLLAIGLGGVLAAALGMLRRTGFALVALAAPLGAWCAINYYAFAALQLWLNFVFPAAAMVLGTTVVVVGRSLRESRLRRQAEAESESLSRYVPPLAAERLRGRARAAGPSRAAVMFVDLVDFTHLSETMTPEDTAELLRQFHRRVERVVRAHHGVIDKFIGDAVLVVFGLPSGTAADAARCARAVAAEFAAWGAALEAAGKPAVRCGIGLHYGPIAVAEVGGADHPQITVAGDTVNVASRLQELTRTWQTTAIASRALIDAAREAGGADALEGFVALPLQEIRGRDRPIAAWSWPGPPAA